MMGVLEGGKCLRGRRSGNGGGEFRREKEKECRRRGKRVRRRATEKLGNKGLGDFASFLPHGILIQSSETSHIKKKVQLDFLIHLQLLVSLHSPDLPVGPFEKFISSPWRFSL